jgi:2',3'-cyclic-nucleotide 2'-phosphodiesterase (5'-nucleotidase family)
LAPLALTITREAQALRKAGVDLVIVTAHAGSSCERFDDAADLSSCDLGGEIMQVALDLPAGLVDQIIGGHVHQGIAHEVNGIAITSSYSNTRAFGRVDYVFNRANRGLIFRQIFEPQPICGYVDNTTELCLAGSEAAGASHVATYADRAVAPNAEVEAIAALAAQQASELKSEKLGVTLETAITREGRSDSALGHLFTDIVLDAVGGDAVIHNVVGGIRADLPQGDLTYGSVYEMYPFDNIVVQLDLTGAELRRVLAREAFRNDGRAGVSGLRVFVACDGDKLNVSMQRPDGSTIEDDDALVVLTTDFLATGGDDVLTPIIPEGGFPIDASQPLIREAIANWLRQHGGSLDAGSFSDSGNPKWNISVAAGDACAP